MSRGTVGSGHRWFGQRVLSLRRGTPPVRLAGQKPVTPDLVRRPLRCLRVRPLSRPWLRGARPRPLSLAVRGGPLQRRWRRALVRLLSFVLLLERGGTPKRGRFLNRLLPGLLAHEPRERENPVETVQRRRVARRVQGATSFGALPRASETPTTKRPLSLRLEASSRTPVRASDTGVSPARLARGCSSRARGLRRLRSSPRSRWRQANTKGTSGNRRRIGVEQALWRVQDRPSRRSDLGGREKARKDALASDAGTGEGRLRKGRNAARKREAARGIAHHTLRRTRVFSLEPLCRFPLESLGTILPVVSRPRRRATSHAMDASDSRSLRPARATVGRRGDRRGARPSHRRLRSLLRSYKERR